VLFRSGQAVGSAVGHAVGFQVGLVVGALDGEDVGVVVGLHAPFVPGPRPAVNWLLSLRSECPLAEAAASRRTQNITLVSIFLVLIFKM
jgi:hypothetical protein